MAPHSSVNGQSFKIQSVLDFASHLQQHLAKPRSLVPQTFPDFSLYLKVLPLPPNELSQKDRVEFNKRGVALWNSCSRSGKDSGRSQDKQNLARARAFAYLLLQSATRTGRRHTGDLLKLFKNALKAARDCLEAKVLDLAAQILEAAATQHESLENDDRYGLPSDAGERAHTSSEYILLRVALGWQQERLDLAEHFYAKITISDLLQDSSGLEKIVDLLFEIGSEEADKKHYEIAIKWLKRAVDLLEEHQTASLSPDIGEVSMNVLHAYARALLAIEDPEAGNEALRVLEILRKDHGHRLPVMLLQLEILSRDSSPNPEAFFSELGAISRSVHLIESNYKMVMHYIHHLRAIDEKLTWKALRQFLVQRLASHDINEWTESAVVTLLWMTTSPLNSSNLPSPEEVSSWLSDIHQSWNQTLSAEAAHGALVLIWKQVEAAAGGQNHVGTICWCQVALHKIFERAGEQNIGKIHRKVAICHLNVGDSQAALDILSKMPPSTQGHRLSRFLAYSVAIRNRNSDGVPHLLSNLASLSDDGNRLLLACVSETMRYGTKRQGAILLQRILDKYNYNPPREVNTCALLRCTIRLLVEVLEQETNIDEEILLRLCAVFKAAARYSVVECDWLSKVGYNTALKHIKIWPTKYIIDLLQYTSEIQYPAYGDQDALGPTQESIEMHRLNINYVQAVLYISESRIAKSTWTTDDMPRTAYDVRSRPDSTGIRRAFYMKAFSKMNEFNSLASSWAQSLGKEGHDQLLAMQITLLPLEFEALLQLAESKSGVDQLSLFGVIGKASRLKASPRTFALFADMILSLATKEEKGDIQEGPVQLPIGVAVTLLRKTINGVRELDDYDVAQASRWIRCVIQLLLETTGGPVSGGDASNLKLLGEITNQALALASSAQGAAAPNKGRGVDVQMTEVKASYPADELEWLCTMLFNLAVDFYVAEKVEMAKEWAMQALGVADVLAKDPSGGDGGALARVLRKKMAKLGWLR